MATFVLPAAPAGDKLAFSRDCRQLFDTRKRKNYGLDMKILRLAPSLVLVTALLASGPTAAAKKKPGLEPYAGSYTGQATSTTSAGALAASATLTFTGKKTGLRGTFLYTGILNQAGVALNVGQTFDLNSKGVVSGRVTVGDLTGVGSGQVALHKKTLTFSILYTLTPAVGTPVTTIQLTGTVKFKTRRATLNAQVGSSDPGFVGTLLVTGKR
jgi:hypothetical protein